MGGKMKMPTYRIYYNAHQNWIRNIGDILTKKQQKITTASAATHADFLLFAPADSLAEVAE